MAKEMQPNPLLLLPPRKINLRIQVACAFFTFAPFPQVGNREETGLLYSELTFNQQMHTAPVIEVFWSVY